jgi:hypothetical protein
LGTKQKKERSGMTFQDALFLVSVW